jgi:hypothetical protein
VAVLLTASADPTLPKTAPAERLADAIHARPFYSREERSPRVPSAPSTFQFLDRRATRARQVPYEAGSAGREMHEAPGYT